MNLYQSFNSSKNQLSHANETRVNLKNSYAAGRSTTKKKPLSICRMIYLQRHSLLNLYCFLAGPVHYIGEDIRQQYEYPKMYHFGIPRNTQSMILNEYFWKFQWKIALLECC